LKWFKQLTLKYSIFRSRIIVANRWSTNWKPNIGGSAFILLYSVSTFIYVLNNEIQISKQVFLSSFAVIIGFILGLVDDHFRVKPYFKLIIQAICATILITGGVYIRFFDYPIANWLLTYVWVIGLMNSINMLDNMDGITAGVSLAIFIWAIIFMLELKVTYLMDYQTLSVVAGSLVGFLILNFYPSKIFMGDKGSQFLGIYLSYISIQYFWNVELLSEKYLNWLQQGLVPLLLFLIPILDTTFVTFNRILKGNSPAIGGKDHTTHHWYYFGLSQRKIAILYFLITILSGFLAYILVNLINNWNKYYSILYIVYVLSITLVFLWAYLIGTRKLSNK
jgi:UDP-GlcNAc:undecaprenyl-phosphate GlcNAc-1-phosphate transferase